MAYRLLYGSYTLYDPFTDDVVTDVKLTAKSNNPDYLDFTISYTHSLYNVIAEKAGFVYLYWDKELLFFGEIESIETELEGDKSVSCNGALAWLSDTVVRRYSTIEGEEDLTAPSSPAGLFQWYITQHNEHVKDSHKQFSVGVNQGAALDTNDYIYRSSTSIPETWAEIEDKLIDSLGGYVFVDYDPLTINWYADVHDKNTQIVDFGVNITDFSKTIDTSSQYTAVRPQGATPEKEDGATEDPKPITIESLPDGGTSDAGITKSGDVIYSVDGVTRYGYREYAYSNTDCETQEGLLTSAIKALNNLLSPTLSVTVKAVDLALYMDGYTHLKVGQAVRVRSKFHNIDEYLMVNSITLDMQDPSNTEYELGADYDSLTGQQSSYLKSLNSGINKSLDSVASLDNSVKDAAKTATEAKDDASAAAATAENAATEAKAAATAASEVKGIADEAKSTAAEAKDTADSVKSVADEAKSTADAASTLATDTSNALTETNKEVETAKDNISTLQTDVSTAQGNITTLQGDVTTVQGNVSTLQTDVSDAKDNITTLQGDVSDVQDNVTTLQTDVSTAQGNITTLQGDVSDVKEDITDLQKQIDGAIETWFYEVEPTTENEPAVNWTTDEEKNKHLGDLYYDTKAGYCYRWQNQNGVYSWSKISDSDATKAMELANDAKSTADHKRTVFVDTPYPPYEIGDLWVQGDEGDILYCATAKKSTETYSESDWVTASKYTDDTATKELEKNVEENYVDNTTAATIGVGGVNLLPGTSTGSTWTTTFSGSLAVDFEASTHTFQRSTTTTECFICSPAIALEPNTQYALSASFSYADSTSETTYAPVKNADIYLLSCHDNKNHIIWNTCNIEITATASRKSWIFTTNDSTVDCSNCYIRFDNNGSTTAGTEAKLLVSDVKLEQGTRVTAWSPSPEDDEELIRKANSSITNVQSNVDEVAKTAEQNANDITTANNHITKINEELQGYSATIGSVNAWMTFSTDGETPTLTLAHKTSGSSTTDTQVVITNTQERFEVNGQALLTLDGPSASVKAENLTLGGYRWRSADSGQRIQLIYVGGTN